MNETIINSICLELNIKEYQVKNTLNLLSEGATIPFIARYRKEATGALDENEINHINEVYTYELNLLKRKVDVIRLIDEKGLLTEELKTSIMNAQKLVDVEDLYRPFKEKKKTKATEAIKLGLEPLAKEIFKENKDILNIAKTFLNENVPTTKFALEQAMFIVAENISEEARFRKYIRNYLYHNGIMKSSKKKNSIKINWIKPHQLLAINRGEKEGILKVELITQMNNIEEFLENKLIHKNNKDTTELLKLSIKDALKRLIMPSIEREIRADLTEKAEESAIKNFGVNLKNLLMQPPIKSKTVLGFDPAFRTGCKLAVISPTGALLHIDVIYPHEPKNDYEGSKKKLLTLIDQYQIDIIAIGNGTASRESESFVASIIKEAKKDVSYIIVNEAGASVYSASKLAQSEFPDLHVEERSAVSIARRLIDPLSELVKIDPKSIGVGMYQHDVTPKKLDNELEFVVSTAVNQVGVNVNTASRELLSYISGLNKKVIDKLLNYKTSIHPESYKIVQGLLKMCNLKETDIGTEKIKEKLSNIDITKIKDELKTDQYTLEDIIKSLISPLRDPRDELNAPILKSDVLTIDDLTIGMELEGTVRNVIDFGAFIDIGLKNDALVHISEITDRYIKHPSEILNVGDIVKCYVLDIDKDKKRVSLTLKRNKTKNFT